MIHFGRDYYLPRTPRALPIPVVRPREAEGARNILVLPELDAGVEMLALDAWLEPLERPRPLPLVTLDGPTAAACCRRLSSSSAFWAATALRSCSSISLLSDSYCLSLSSSSISAISWVAPCHDGSRISLWLCSVWDSIFVHVFNNWDAELTVLFTVYINVRIPQYLQP